MTIETFDPLDKAYIRTVVEHGRLPGMGVGSAHAAMRAFMESPAFIDHLADALHDSAGLMITSIIEFNCYCRRIATSDGTKDGPQDENWDHTGEPYDPAHWNATDPPLCEKTAAGIVERMLHR